MNLKELQAMIKEELDAYVNEAEVDVDVDADDVKADGDDSMEMLKKIYDMLKPKFEDMDGDMGDMDEAEDMEEAEMEEMSDMEEEMVDEVKDDEKKDEAADMEERAGQGFGDPGGKTSAGKDAGYTPAKTTKGDGRLHEGFTARMKKLANIKG